jgi:hypothetical protein
VTGRRCSVCTNPQVTIIDSLLSTGSSVRSVAHLYGVARTTLGRHACHVLPSKKRFAAIGGTVGPSGPGDPLSEAFRLAEHAKTSRERLRALEAIRAATKLSLRGRVALAKEDRTLLDNNVRTAEEVYKHATDFETAARALAGWREALLQRIDAAGDEQPVEVPYPTITVNGVTPEWLAGEGTYVVPAADYWRRVPQQYRDHERYGVSRSLAIAWHSGDAVPERIHVHDVEGNVVWARQGGGDDD